MGQIDPVVRFEENNRVGLTSVSVLDLDSGGSPSVTPDPCVLWVSH